MDEQLCCFVEPVAPPAAVWPALRLRLDAELLALAAHGPIRFVTTGASAFDRLAGEQARRLAAQMPQVHCIQEDAVKGKKLQELIARCRYCICYLPDEASMDTPVMSFVFEQNIGIIAIDGVDEH